MQKTVGYTKPLYILPFDHRNTFTKALFGNINIEDLTHAQIDTIKLAKQLVYAGVKYGITLGIPQEYSAILVDEQFGDGVIRSAMQAKILTAVCTEQTGKDEFAFEYGEDFALHINKYNPDFVKVLIRYNPEGDKELNKRQCSKLKILSDFCTQNNYKYLFEMLVPPTPTQADLPKTIYEEQLRPGLTCTAIAEIQAAGIEADIWKIEGMFARTDYINVSKQMRAGGRQQVGLIILGKADNQEHVDHWLRTGAGVPGVIGFAVGRTVFLDAVAQFAQKKLTEQEAIKLIGTNYFTCYKVFTEAKN